MDYYGFEDRDFLRKEVYSFLQGDNLSRFQAFEDSIKGGILMRELGIERFIYDFNDSGLIGFDEFKG